MSRPAILIVDDEENAREGLRDLLGEEGYEIQTAENGRTGLEKATGSAPDIILCDLKMPVMDGMAMLRELKERDCPSSFIVMTAFGSVRTAVQAMHLGAEDYVTKPIDLDELQLLVKRTLEKRALQAETGRLRQKLDEEFHFDNLVGSSPEMQRLMKLTRQIAPTSATVLLTGETGTGKELIAEAIHQNSLRSRGPFVKVNCAALTESLLESELFGHERGSFTGADAQRRGKFEIADGGTLFLDEIGEISPSTQVKLLRFLQERALERVGGNETINLDVRVIAATNRDLEAAIHDGIFRSDLYYRLNVITIEMPPLRRRRTDLPALIDHFIEKFNERHGKLVSEVDPEAMLRLTRYHWPGNVRELENVIERAVVLADGPNLQPQNLPAFILQADLSDDELPPPIPGTPIKEIERWAIVKTLESFDGHRAKTAEVLGMSVRALQYKLKDFGLIERGSHDGTLTHYEEED